MWEAIGYVTSGITLGAFLAAVAAWVYRGKLLQQERLIQTAPESDRAALVARALEFFEVNTAKLTREQQYDLALKQIHARASRFLITAAVVLVIALLAAVVTAFAVYAGTTSERPSRSDSEKDGSDLMVSSLDNPGRVIPLDGHPVVAKDPRPVLTGGAKVSLTLSHNRKGDHSIIVWGLKLELVKYEPRPSPQFAYLLDSKAVIGKGTVVPHVFHVSLAGPEVRSKWVKSERKVLEARSDNFLDTDEPRRITVRNNADDIEEIECRILAIRPGSYEVRLVVLYNVSGVDRRKYSESILIYNQD